MLLTLAHYSDKLKLRAPFILVGLSMILIGFAINISSAPSGAKYFGTFFCVAGSYGAFSGVVAWCALSPAPSSRFPREAKADDVNRLGNNLSGQYKRGVGMALQIGIGNFAGAIASNIYRTQDAPHYILGRASSLPISFYLDSGLTTRRWSRTHVRRDRIHLGADGGGTVPAYQREAG